MTFAKLLSLSATAFIAPAFFTAVYAADLTVEIKGVATSNGQVFIALYDKADGWMRGGLKNVGVTANKDGVSYEFKDLPAGDYAISIYHDENGNGKFDTNLVGMPIEPYAFSNNAAGNFGPPTFEQAKFSVGADKTTVTLNFK